MQSYEELFDIYDNSQVSIQHHEILFVEVPTEDGSGDTERGMLEINGASCNPYDRHKYSFVIDKNGVVAAVRFFLPNGIDKLGDVFATSPYGIVKKNRTGIGATTLELRARRNSIVVVPTRSLAYTKAKGSWDDDLKKYTTYYKGGRITGFNMPSVEEYLNDKSIEYKKFIVVIDSLPTLLAEIGEDVYKNFFIMIDEIDSYQYDSSYRPNMELGFDYYFKFPRSKRCLVSATMGVFSDPRINEEPVIDLVFSQPSPRKINIQHTNHPIVTTRKLIEKIIAEHPHDKILVAYNLVTRGILRIIETLPDELKQKCGVLCGAKSKNSVGDYYREIIDTKLPEQISLMSCTYFVGVDITEPFHLITVADAGYKHTLLSPDKLQQIAGRCRVENGLLSETIIYSTKEDTLDISIDDIAKEILADVKNFSDYATVSKELKQKFTWLIIGNADITDEEIVEHSLHSYYGSSEISLMRINGDKHLVPSYFNIDNALIQIQLGRQIYSDPNILPDLLAKEGNTLSILPSINETETVSQDVISEISTTVAQVEKEERDNFIQQLREKGTIEERGNLALGLRTDCSRKNSLFLEHFIELQEFVPFDKLVELLDLYDNSPKYDLTYNYDRLRKTVMLWALDEQHPIKTTIHSHFQVNKFYTSREITNGVNAVWHGIWGFPMLSAKMAYPILDYFVRRSERSSTKRGSQKINGYTILSFDVLGIECEPIRKIPATENLSRLFTPTKRTHFPNKSKQK